MSTTMQDTNTTHPDWCTTSHDIDPDGGHSGPSWPRIPSLSHDPVSISTGSDDERRMVVFIEAAGLALSPEQARAAGLALLSAASWAKDHTAVTA